MSWLFLTMIMLMLVLIKFFTIHKREVLNVNINIKLLFDDPWF